MSGRGEDNYRVYVDMEHHRKYICDYPLVNENKLYVSTELMIKLYEYRSKEKHLS